MKSLRTFLFVVWFYLSLAVVATGLSPALLMGHGQAMWVVKLWARVALFGYRWIAGVRVQTLGTRNVPTGGALVASKHQGLLDFVALIAVLGRETLHRITGHDERPAAPTPTEEAAPA